MGWLKNIGNTLKKAGSDTVHEVKRHPVIYGAAALGAAGLGLGAIGGLSGIASKFGGGTSAQPQAEDDFYNAIPGTTGYKPPGQGILGTVGSFLSGHKNDILDYGQAAEGAYDKYRSVADYNKRAPLRDAGMRGLLDTSTPDTSAVFADPNAPTKYRSVSVGSRGKI